MDSEYFALNLYNCWIFPFWVFIICSNFLNAFPDFNISVANFSPWPFFAFPAISNNLPANNIDFSSKSFGGLTFPRTFKTSFISRIGPIPFPIGSEPSVKRTSNIKSNF
jgi:hypothetical protein